MMKNNKKSKKRKQITALLLATLLVFQNVKIGVANIVDVDDSIDATVEAVEESEIVQIEEVNTELEDETDDFEGIDKKELQEELQETAIDEMELFLNESMEVQEEDSIAKAASSGEVISSGSCGENVIYVLEVLDSEWVLTISGNGDMKNYDFTHEPWRDYRYNIEKIIIENGVTSIGNGAFLECSNLISVEIPSSVTSIGNGAFLECSSLISVEIPSSVTSIGDDAFLECSSLISVEIPSSVTSIESFAFGRCSSLTNVKIPSSVTSIGNNAFENCSSLTSVEIPSSVISIGNSAFLGCSSLTNVKIPSSVTSIEAFAFENCSSLTSVEIPSSVTSIREGTFSGCSNLISVEIPFSVTSIEMTTFSGCSKLSIIRILNPNCYIYNSGNTIPRSTIIYGYTNSTAQSYAEKYNRTFVSLGTAPEIPDDNNIISEFKIDASKTGELNNIVIILGTLTLSDNAEASSDTLQKEVANITWISSDSSIAEVTDCVGLDSINNRSTTLMIHVASKKEGTVTITGTASNGMTASCEVTVKISGEFITVTGENTYYYWDNHIYDNNDKVCENIPLELTVKNITENKLKDIILQVAVAPGICFENNDCIEKIKLEDLDVGEEVIINLRLLLSDFENNTMGQRYSTILYVSLTNEAEEPIYVYEEFSLTISYLFNFSVDNFSFINEDAAFWDASIGEEDKCYISSEAKNKISLGNYLDIIFMQELDNISGWNGSCFGMSSFVAAAFAGIISSSQFGEDIVYDLKTPVSYAVDGDTLLRDVINIVQCATITKMRMFNKPLFNSQKKFAEEIVTALKAAKETSCLPVIEFKIDIGNHAVVPYSISEYEDEYSIWIYDPNYNEPQKMTISKDYETVTYRDSKNVKFNEIVTNLDIMNINTYAPGLLPDSTLRSANRSVRTDQISENTEHDFTTILIDTSSEVMISNSVGQSLKVKGDEILSGDLEVINIKGVAGMDEKYVLIILSNDTSETQEFQIQSNTLNEITAVISDNNNICFINTEGNNHTAVYSSKGKISVTSSEKIAGKITYSNLEFIENTDVFGLSLSGKDVSNMEIIVEDSKVQVYSDNLSNMTLTSESKRNEYYEKQISLPSGNNITLSGDGEGNLAPENKPNDKENEYFISYNLSGGTLNENTNPSKYTSMTETFTLNNPTREGYIFVGWTGSNGEIPQITVTIKKGSTGDLSYTANWEQNTSSGDDPNHSKEEEYIISYTLNGGSFNISENPNNYTNKTETFTLNNPIREGYTFIGWTGSNGTAPQKNVTIEKGTTGNLSYTANWKRNISSNNSSDSDDDSSSDDNNDDYNLIPINTVISFTGKWIQDKIGWWYKNADGSYPANKWQFINDKWYFFNKEGYMVTGWILSNNQWYYLDTDGAMLEDSWIFYKNHWYFLKSGNGDMAIGWILWKNKWYYLNENGDMAVNCITPDGYQVDSNGEWIIR